MGLTRFTILPCCRFFALRARALRVRCMDPGLYPTMGFALAGIENTNTLSIRLTFRQRGNWQVREREGEETRATLEGMFSEFPHVESAIPYPR